MKAACRQVAFGGCLEARLEPAADGSAVLRSTEPLQAYPLRLSDRLLEHAARSPDRLFVARRAAGTARWQTISYGQMLQRARAIGQWLLDQGASVERPVAILSENDLEHLSLAFGAMWAGVPHVPVSPAYSLLSQDFGKLRHIMNAATPGLIYASSTAFDRAIAAVAPPDARLIFADAAAAEPGRPELGGRPITAFSQLLAQAPGAAVDAAQAATGPDTIVKFLFTSGSTKDPKA